MAATLGEKIRAARLEQRLTQEELAGRDFAKSYISELERGTRAPRLPTLKIIARRLNRPLSYFLDGVQEDSEPEAYLAIGLAHFNAGAVHEAHEALERALDLAIQQGERCPPQPDRTGARLRQPKTRQHPASLAPR